MKRIAALLAVLSTAFCTTAAGSAGGGAASLTEASGLPDGTWASFVGVLVKDVHPGGSFSVRESWTDAFSLTVYPSQPVVLSPFQAIDVSGTIQVSANGKRTLNATSVQVYTDSTGNTILTPMPYLFIGEDTGTYFFRVNAQTGAVDPDDSPSNPFDAVSQLEPRYPYYFVGSAALAPSGSVIVGNDNGFLYLLDGYDLMLQDSYDTSSGNSENKYICSSPALSYSAQSGYKWIYVVSRSDNGRGDGKGTLLAFRQSAN